MAVQIELRRDTAANWAAVNPLLTQGEPALELNTRKIKVGDGVSLYNALPYWVDPSAPSGQVEVTITATENLPAFTAVTSQGKKADSANPSASFGRVIGLATAFIGSGFSGSVIEAGEITNGAWGWTTGDPIFLNGTGLSSTPPASGFVQQVGTAKGPTIIIVDIDTPVLL